MTEQHIGVTLPYTYEEIDPKSFSIIGRLAVNPSAYQIKAPPPVVGYWALPCGDTPYKTKFSAYSKPNWLHRTALRIVLGIKWEDAK